MVRAHLDLNKYFNAVHVGAIPEGAGGGKYWNGSHVRALMPDGAESDAKENLQLVPSAAKDRKEPSVTDAASSTKVCYTENRRKLLNAIGKSIERNRSDDRGGRAKHKRDYAPQWAGCGKLIVNSRRKQHVTVNLRSMSCDTSTSCGMRGVQLSQM